MRTVAAFRAVVMERPPAAGGGVMWGRARCFDGPPAPIRRVSHVTLVRRRVDHRGFACLPWKGYR